MAVSTRRTPAAGEPIVSAAAAAGSGATIWSALTDAVTRASAPVGFQPRTPVGTEGVAGLLTGKVAVPRGSSLIPGATSDPAGIATVEKAARQREERFRLPAGSAEILVDYYRASGGLFPELSGGLGAAGGGYADGNVTTARPGGAAAALAGGLDTSTLIAIGAGALALLLLLRRGGK